MFPNRREFTGFSNDCLNTTVVGVGGQSIQPGTDSQKQTIAT
jgi:hypothetical protein